MCLDMFKKDFKYNKHMAHITPDQIRDLSKGSKLHNNVIRWSVHSPDMLQLPASCSGKPCKVLVAPVAEHFKFFALLAHGILRKNDNKPDLTEDEQRRIYESPDTAQLASRRLDDVEESARLMGFELCQLSPLLLPNLPGLVNLHICGPGLARDGDEPIFINPATDPVVFGLVKTEGPQAGLMSPLTYGAQFVVGQHEFGVFGKSHDFLTGSPETARLMRSSVDIPLKVL